MFISPAGWSAYISEEGHLKRMWNRNSGKGKQTEILWQYGSERIRRNYMLQGVVSILWAVLPNSHLESFVTHHAEIH